MEFKIPPSSVRFLLLSGGCVGHICTGALKFPKSIVNFPKILKFYGCIGFTLFWYWTSFQLFSGVSARILARNCVLRLKISYCTAARSKTGEIPNTFTCQTVNYRASVQLCCTSQQCLPIDTLRHFNICTPLDSFQ